MNLKKVNKWVLFIIIVIKIISCKSKTIEILPKNLISEYFPLEIGRYITYEVNETNYNITSIQYKKYFLKLVIKDTFYLLPNDPVNYRIETYVKSLSDSIWQFDSVWSVQMNGQYTIFNRNNLPLAILCDPVQNGTVWNGNLYNNRTKVNFRYTNLFKPWIIGSTHQFENTIMVVSERSRSCIDKRIAFDVYAKNVGLIYHYREFLFYEQRNGGGAISCDSVIQYGSKHYWTILDYGKE